MVGSCDLQLLNKGSTVWRAERLRLKENFGASFQDHTMLKACLGR